MISKEDIDKFYEYLNTKNIKKLNSQIVKATGYGKSTVSTYLSRAKDPSEEFISAVYKMFGESSLNVPHENDDADSNNNDIKNLPGDEVTRQILLNLSESHKNLTAAHKEVTAANHILASNEKVLLSQAVTTGDVASETVEALEQKVRGLLEVVIRMGTGPGKMWLSEQEARAELHNVFHETKEGG